ncbi:MAG: hypothetical protein WCI21_09815, partial [Alphaproteobacteria bacterium]
HVMDLGFTDHTALIVGGVRFALDDFRHSSPSTMFVALACFGAALVLGPKLAARPSRTDK